MRESIIIENVKILTSSGFLAGSITIENGVISKIGKVSSESGIKRLDAGGRLALPGLIDCHVHLRGLNLSYKEDFFSGTCAAAVGGFATVLDMPNTDPLTDSVKNLELKKSQASRQAVINVGFHALPPAEKSEINPLVKKGVKSFKLYLGDKRYTNSAFIDESLPSISSECAKQGVPLTVHAEAPFELETRAESIKDRDFTIGSFTLIHSPEAESKGVNLTCNSAEKARIHFCHLSCKKALERLKACKEIRSNITAEATPHHLFLTEKDLRRLGQSALTNPPLRSSSKISLWEAIVGGDIDAVASDHAPHSLKEKTAKDLKKVPPGIPGLETTLPLMLNAVNKGLISIKRVTQLLAENPARIFSLINKGFLKNGFDGDVTIVDLKHKHMIDPSRFYSKAKYTPFEGIKCVGKAWAVVVAGHLAMQEGEITAEKGEGNIIA